MNPYLLITADKFSVQKTREQKLIRPVGEGSLPPGNYYAGLTKM